jgi:hypothetical protein
VIALEVHEVDSQQHQIALATLGMPRRAKSSVKDADDSAGELD